MVGGFRERALALGVLWFELLTDTCFTMISVSRAYSRIVQALARTLLIAAYHEILLVARHGRGYLVGSRRAMAARSENQPMFVFVFL